MSEQSMSEKENNRVIMTNFTIIIPARLASSRLPEKLLQTIGDKPVLAHSYQAAQQSDATRVVIAADDERIITAMQGFDVEVILTCKDHESGTDRLAECVDLLDLPDDEIIVNLQGDEPFMPADLVNLCAQTLASDTQVSVATLASRMSNENVADIDNDDIDNAVNNPNVVKVVVNHRGHALYFSRAPIPFNRDGATLNSGQHYLHHLGIYAYRAGFLRRYPQLRASALEHIEKLEQLRILDNGEHIAVAVVAEKPPKGIDTQSDLDAARQHYLAAQY